jgi:(R,R)-butanediol dehydrogenase/meso-butanediol dehydrogenase/diacetyl reductase
MLRSEMTIITSQGYPTEIFEVTPEIAEHQQRFSRLISHRSPSPTLAGPSSSRSPPAPPGR